MQRGARPLETRERECRDPARESEREQSPETQTESVSVVGEQRRVRDVCNILVFVQATHAGAGNYTRPRTPHDSTNQLLTPYPSRESF